MPALKIPKEKFTGKKAFKELNEKCYWEEKRVGYWRDGLQKDDTALPFPVRMKAEGYDREKFMKRLAKIEAKAKSLAYKGWSNHRWYKDTKNGSREFNYKGWFWPAGYSTYLEAGVLPSREFYNFIMGEDLETLPSYCRSAKKKKVKVEENDDEERNDILIGKLEITDSTQVVVQLTDAGSLKPRIDIRVWYKTKKMKEFAPSPKGINAPAENIADLEKLLANARKLLLKL